MAIYASRRRHVIVLMTLTCDDAGLLCSVLYFNGLTAERFVGGLDKLGQYFGRMFVWHNIQPMAVWLLHKQIGIP
ncbi:hypothetical protein P4S72_24990 [Vibrio sp. PP-XX7]